MRREVSTDTKGGAARLRQILAARRRLLVFAAYAGISAAAYALAFLLRFEFRWPAEYVAAFGQSVALLVALRIVFVRAFRLPVTQWRFVGTHDILQLVAASTLGSAFFFLLTRLLPTSAPPIPRSVILLEWLLWTYLIAALWIGYRTGFERLRRFRVRDRRGRRVLIVGAGEAGNLLAREMLRCPTGYDPVGFVDDDPSKWGGRLHGIEVIGPPMELAQVVAAAGVEEIIIAMPSAEPGRLRAIVDNCQATRLPFKVLPGIREVLAGDVNLAQLRELRIEDLLGRDPIQLELPELADDLCERTVMITGAAGSIGSELARQVALHEPRSLVLLDQAETDLFFLQLELRDKHPDMSLHAVIGDIVDPVTVRNAFVRFAPERVFHAAAYKHVPMMEANPREAIRNNVLGTWRVAEAAGRAGTEQFVLVSTDKAVRPANVMGATKRLAELVVLDMQQRFPATAYAAVRFGNVLGSQGSVIPIFREQLKAGKPLTVTHPDATRYFMTIPEAVQLILQASLLPEVRGRIVMLEMGEPVRILQLAENLLRLAGRANGNGAGVVFTGLRPGEQLHEELIGPGEHAIPTAIPKVCLIGNGNGRHGVAARVARLEDMLLGGHDSAALQLLVTLVPELAAYERASTPAPPTPAAALAVAPPPAPRRPRSVTQAVRLPG